jgi:DNA-binding NtrC family response regulator
VSTKSILVVEHDTSTRMMIRMVLRREGFGVDEAVNASAAIEAIKAKTYDAVVLDLTLPDGRAEDVLNVVAIQRPEARVVVISAGSPASMHNIASPNIEAKLRKPFDIRQLVSAVRRCTKH